MCYLELVGFVNEGGPQFRVHKFQGTLAWGNCINLGIKARQIILIVVSSENHCETKLDSAL